MAILRTDGLTRFAFNMLELGNIPVDILDAMLEAEADIIEPAQKQKGREYGIYRTGETVESIERTDHDGTVWSRGERCIYIMPKGMNAKGNRNAEVAFINEYGKHNQPARPFMRDANERHMDEAVDAAIKIYDNYLKSKGF